MGRPTAFIDTSDLADLFIPRFVRVADAARARHGRAAILVSANEGIRPLYAALAGTTFDGTGLDFYLVQERIGAGDRRESQLADLLPRGARLVLPPVSSDPFAAGSAYADLVEGRLGRRGRFDLAHIHLTDADAYLGFDDERAEESSRVEVRELESGGEIVVRGRAVLEARLTWFTALGEADSEVARARDFERRYAGTGFEPEWWMDRESVATWKIR